MSKTTKTIKATKTKVMKAIAAIGKKSALIGCDSATVHQRRE